MIYFCRIRDRNDKNSWGKYNWERKAWTWPDNCDWSEKGKLFKDKAIKDLLAKDYKKYNKQIIDLEKKISNENEKPNFKNDELRKRQYLSGLSIEDLELILHPMAEEGKEASGSMGDDTPVAVLSSHFRPVSHYFRQNFSQVTNPQ